MSTLRRLLAALSVALLFVPVVAAQEPPIPPAPPAEPTPPPAPPSPPSSPTAEQTAPRREPKSLGHRLLFYIPNRVFDVLDIVRLRVRAGPGLSVGARVTELVDVNFGGYATFYAGIHGPRSRPEIPWPIGIENYAGIEVSVIEVGSDESGRFAPQYGPLEVGFGTQLIVLGFDLGVEPYDVLDFGLGLLTLDPKGDDF